MELKHQNLTSGRLKGITGTKRRSFHNEFYGPSDSSSLRLFLNFLIVNA